MVSDRGTLKKSGSIGTDTAGDNYIPPLRSPPIPFGIALCHIRFRQSGLRPVARDGVVPPPALREHDHDSISSRRLDVRRGDTVVPPPMYFQFKHPINPLKMAVLVSFSSGFATQSPLNVVFWTLLTTQKSRVSVTKYWQHGAKTRWCNKLQPSSAR